MLSKTEKRLLDLLRELPEERAEELVEFAEFLHERHGGRREILERVDIPRPSEENVIRAIKRLRATYPMLDPARLLNETTALMSQHLTQGRDRAEVIDELEILFRTHYEKIQREDAGEKS
ncbi:MAG: hypothetical protein BMS9Abin22_001 [Gammaproteobacteria bacterium]|nr:MAG: hypothetical protein BMS9Abin22_001 [Gammaproteobacteria bacterium]